MREVEPLVDDLTKSGFGGSQVELAKALDGLTEHTNALHELHAALLAREKLAQKAEAHLDREFAPRPS